MKELIQSELSIFKSEISKEMKLMSNKISETSEENSKLKIKVNIKKLEKLGNQLRSRGR